MNIEEIVDKIFLYLTQNNSFCVDFFYKFDKVRAKRICVTLDNINKEFRDIKELSTHFKNDANIDDVINESKMIIKSLKDILINEIDELLICNSLDIENFYYNKNINESDFDYSKVILEIRPGVGGHEAAIFALDLLKMYQRYADSLGLSYELMEITYLTNDSIRESLIAFSGKNAYGLFNLEGGVHRVQRVPKTESLGRIHTSTASVIVLPETRNVSSVLKDKDLRIDTYRSSGCGGQHVNKTDSAVRITHIPTGIVVQQQDEKSQHMNKQKAMRILSIRVHQFYTSKIQEQVIATRKDQVKNSLRSEKIRTYNMKTRVTDHRANISIHNVEGFMLGEYLFKIHKQLRLQLLLEILGYKN